MEKKVCTRSIKMKQYTDYSFPVLLLLYFVNLLNFTPTIRAFEAPRSYTDQAILRCDSQSVGRFKKNITYNWYKGGVHISEIPELFGKYKLTQNGALVLNRINHFLHGEYTCNIDVENYTIGVSTIYFDRLQQVPAGRTCKEENCLRVEDCYAPLPMERMGVCSSIKDICCDLNNLAPLGLPVKGKIALLECDKEGIPGLKYEWSRYGIKLIYHPTIKDRFTVTKSGHLLLNNVSPGIYGEYTCSIDGKVVGVTTLDDTEILSPEGVDVSKCVKAKSCRRPLRGACPEEQQVECADVSNIVFDRCEQYQGTCKKSCESAFIRKADNCPRGYDCCTTTTLYEPLSFISTEKPNRIKEIEYKVET